MALRVAYQSALILAVFVSMLASVSSNVALRSPEALVVIRDAFERWIMDDGLSQSLEVQKVRYGPRADNPSAQWLKLELRFITQNTDQDAEDRRFLEWLEEYRGKTGVTLPEAIFYKLVHAAQIPRADAYVTIKVVERDFETLRDQDAGRIVFRERPNRLIRQPLMLQGIVEPKPEHKAETPSRAGTASNDLSRRVERYLQDYFSLKNKTGLDPPKVDTVDLEQDHVSIEVEGIKNVVLTGKDYWEQLQISIDIQVDGRAVCYLDGKYATGIGGFLPAADSYKDMDMNPEFRQKLDRFGKTLKLDLQKHFVPDLN